MLLFYSEGPIRKTGSMGSFGGDSGLYYFLPRKSRDQMIQALEAAGFQSYDRVSYAMDTARPIQGNEQGH